MAIDLDTFKAIFPELCDVGSNVVEAFAQEVENYLCPDSWGSCYDTACRYLIAHEIALSKQRQEAAAGAVAGGGTIQSVSADGLSVSFAVPQFATQGSIDETLYARTPYGLKYLQLRENCIAGGRLAGSVQNTAAEQSIC